LASGKFEELMRGEAKQAVQATIQEHALCIATVDVGAAGGLGDTPVAAGTLSASACKCGCWSAVET
jgi:hypothetical protein